jgi:sugar lactone lactonase YvrE
MQVIVEGIFFGEGPRWYEGALWFSDIHGGAVHRYHDGRLGVVLEIDEQPSGLGWLPDGRLLVACMRSNRVIRVEADGAVVTHADLAGLARGCINDMIVTKAGVAFVGDMGARVFEEHPDYSVPGHLFRIDPAGVATVVHDEMRAPNGMVLSDDERRLVVAESAGLRLTAFDLDADANPSNMRTFAALRPGRPDVPVAAPDGICLDVEGAVWVADPAGARVLRVREGGDVLDERIVEGLVPVACVLGGEDRRTLYVCAAESWTYKEVLQAPKGRILADRVDVPGAGRP